MTAAGLPTLAVETACLLLALVSLHPLLTPGYLWGHDTGAHLFRIAEVARALREGVLYPRFVPDAYGGLGGPILDFNPVLPYYFPALLVLLGAGPIASLKIAAGAATIAGGAAVRIFARPHVGRIGAAVAALAYVYLPYRIADLYVRMAYSELVAMIFFPLALAAARRAARNPSPRRIAISALAMALILATHFPTSVIGLPAVLLYALATSKAGARARGAVSFAAAFALALALSAFSWLPALTEQAGTHYQDSTSGYDNYRNHFLEWPQLFSTQWGFGQSLPGSHDQMSFQIGWAHVLALATAGVVAYWSRRLRGIAIFALTIAVGGSLFMLTPAQPIWDRLPIVQNVQFPWRILMAVGLGTSLAAGIVVAFPSISAAGFEVPRKSPDASKRGRGARKSRGDGRDRPQGRAAQIVVSTLLSILLVAASVPYLRARGGDGKDADFTPEGIRRQYFGELKFQPKEVETLHFSPAGPRAELLDAGGMPIAGGTATVAEERTHRTIVDVDAPAPATLRLHLFNTPGWVARADGRDLVVRSEPRTALVLVDLPAGRHRVELRFADTPMRLLGWILTLAGALGSAGAFVLDRARGRGGVGTGLQPVDSAGTSP